MAIKINVETPPVYGAIKNAPIGLAPDAAWTKAQRDAGYRREIPLGSTGIGTNRVAPPAPRQQLAQLLSNSAYPINRSDGGGRQWNGPGWTFGNGGNRGGYTTSAPGWGGGNSSAGSGYGMSGRDWR